MKAKIMDTDIMQLDDDQLRAKLIDVGVDMGPIVDTTRKFYRSLLAKKLQKQHINHESSSSEEEIVDEDEEDYNQENVQSQVSYSKQGTYTETMTYRRPVDTDSTDFRRRVIDTPGLKHGNTTPSPLKETNTSSNPSFCSKFCVGVLAILCLLIIVVYFHMEPAKSPVEEIDGI